MFLMLIKILEYRQVLGENHVPCSGQNECCRGVHRRRNNGTVLVLLIRAIGDVSKVAKRVRKLKKSR